MGMVDAECRKVVLAEAGHVVARSQKIAALRGVNEHFRIGAVSVGTVVLDGHLLVAVGH